MLPLRRLFPALATPSVVLACQAAGPARGPLEGAWKHVEVSFTSPDTSGTVTDPQPSLYLFTSHHYSIMLVTGSGPRAQFQDMSDPTDAEKVAAYNFFVANSGTYVLSDSTIETRAIVAKVPNVMGQSQTYFYRLRADSLWLRFRPRTDPAFEVRLTLLRM